MIKVRLLGQFGIDTVSSPLIYIRFCSYILEHSCQGDMLDSMAFILCIYYGVHFVQIKKHIVLDRKDQQVREERAMPSTIRASAPASTRMPMTASPNWPLAVTVARGTYGENLSYYGEFLLYSRQLMNVQNERHRTP